ncbi:MAG TPA: ABC-2 family transporter protein [Vicinamibacterales bacterium]|nr:ABC-2 family transporter protein [Vicinamibacterales bacterium]
MRRQSANLSFARALLATSLKAAAALRGAFAMQVVFMMLNNVTFFVFWWALMRRVPEIRGWRLGDIQILFGVVAAGFGLTVTVAGGVRHLGRFIDDGELDTMLTQPKPVLLHALGLRLQASGLGDVLSGVAFIAWSGQVSWREAPLVLLAIAASAVVILACGIVFQSLAFWLGDVETAARQLWELLITFALYPEPLFGGMLRLVLFTVLPAGFVGYVPARLAQRPSAALVLLVVAAAATYLIVAAAVFERGLKRYASGSRFSVHG